MKFTPRTLPSLLPISLFTAFFLLAIPQAQAGPWTKSAGEFYAKIGEGFYTADAYRSATGELIDGTEYLSATTFIYAEYGLLDGLHLQTYIPFMTARNQFAGQSYSDTGFGDATLALQVSPFKNLSFPTSFRLEAKIPLYSGNRAPDVPAGTPGRGDAQYDFNIWASAGGSLYPIPLYFYVDVGFQYRSDITLADVFPGPFSNGVLFAAQIGYTFFDRATVALNSGGILTLEEDYISKSYITVGPSIFFTLNDLIAIEADVNWTPYSRNSADGFSFGLGVSFRS